MKKITNMFMIGMLSIMFMSCASIEPGEEGFMFYPYGDGVEKDHPYSEGVITKAPWNDMITYNVLQQSRTYESSVMDKNGTEINVKVSVNFNPTRGKISFLHLKHGVGYPQSFIDVKVKGAIKNVIGRYTYEEVYSTKREALEDEIDEILLTEFADNFITYNFSEIADVNLPENIAKEITNKETQKQTNLKAKEKEKEEEYLANARIQKARGDESILIKAQFEADAIRVKSEQLRKSPKYIEYIKAERWDGKLPNVMSGSGAGFIIDLKR
ncbi:hypothetical protein COB55_03915 [Candidatus Wolfebacteria bacterium]|nr:MAG: hypothetical protein COB55_03915 [Candidatus Wolfebacteria bacterium]